MFRLVYVILKKGVLLFNFFENKKILIEYMGRTNDRSLKDAIEQMLQVYKLRRKFDETSLIIAWPEMMGKAVANRTKDIFIRDRKLFIRLESAVIKNELLMMRSNIIEKMNERAGTSIIDEIIFL
jgi:predicted nucleic acid-binding Zn ribbon protein